MQGTPDWISGIRADLDHAERLEADFAYYCETLFRIRPKAGGLIPFKLNKAQLTLHNKLEALKATTGMARASCSSPASSAAARTFPRVCSSARSPIPAFEPASSRTRNPRRGTSTRWCAVSTITFPTK